MSFYILSSFIEGYCGGNCWFKAGGGGRRMAVEIEKMFAR
jgi:hypothetical protein